MRYLRVEECPECKGETRDDGFQCLLHHGTGEIRTPVTLPEILAENGAVEIWATFGGNGELICTTSDTEGSKKMQAQMKDFFKHPTSTDPPTTWEDLERQGYTCELVDVIRRKP